MERRGESGKDTCARKPSRLPQQAVTGNVTERTFSLKHQADLISTAGAVDGICEESG
jgi:hypothetical protein